jgi:hypothetical protein
VLLCILHQRFNFCARRRLLSKERTGGCVPVAAWRARFQEVQATQPPRPRARQLASFETAFICRAR